MKRISKTFKYALSKIQSIQVFMKTKMLILFLILSGTMMAQDRSATVEQGVHELTELYQLNDQQVEEMYTILERKERNLAEIAELEQSDYRIYLEKKGIIRKHTEGSIRRFLNDDQRRIQYQQQAEYRIATSNMIKELQAAGKTKAEIELILLERG